MAPRPAIDRTNAPLMDRDAIQTEHVAVNEWYPSTFRANALEFARMIMQAPFQVGDGRSVARFMFSHLDDEFDDKPDSWVPQRVLGQGGFGTVGYWRKLDEKSETIDEVAIKEQAHAIPHTHMPHYQETAEMRSDGIAEEAVLHAGLQVKEALAQAANEDDVYTEVDRNAHIPPLRAYKYLEDPKKSRMYMCYAPHGTLHDVMLLYKACGQSVPEPFAWTVFLSVALMLQQQRGALPEQSVLYQYRARPRNESEDWIVHLDIKPLNVLLDYAPAADHAINRAWENEHYPDDPTSLYPGVWLNDYGLAIDNAEKPHSKVWKNWSTRHWRAPELLDQFAKRWQAPPNSGQSSTALATDVWVLAKMVYDLISNWDSDEVENILTRELTEQYYTEKMHFLLTDDMNQQKTYSKALITILHKCLRVEAADRPSIDDIVRVATNCLNQWKDRFNENHSPETKNRFRLFFRNCELDQLPLAEDQRFPRVNLNDLRALKYRDPDAPANFDPRLWGPPERRPPGDISPMMDRHFQLNDGVLAIGHDSPAESGAAFSPLQSNGSHDSPSPPPFQRSPAPSPPESPQPQSKDPDVQQWLGDGMKAIRKRLKQLNSTAKGTAKLPLAKALVKLERKNGSQQPRQSVASGVGRGGRQPRTSRRQTGQTATAATNGGGRVLRTRKARGR